MPGLKYKPSVQPFTDEAGSDTVMSRMIMLVTISMLKQETRRTLTCEQLCQIYCKSDLTGSDTRQYKTRKIQSFMQTCEFS